ncbi:MAG: aminopeptidase P N-terminal domain-containing protein, partial [Bacteroidota bacterium]
MKDPFSYKFFRKNRQKLKAHIDNDSLAFLYSNHRMPRNGDQYFPFRQNSDLFYLSGIEQEGTILLIDKENEYLFIEEPDRLSSLWEGDKLQAEQAKSISGIENIQWTHQFGNITDKLLRTKKKLYFNTTEKLNQGGIKPQDQIYLEHFRARYPFHMFLSLKPVLSELRLRKEPEETDAIQHAIDITGKALKRVFEMIRPGISEKAMEAEIKREFMLHHANGYAFDPIIASGRNATVLHYSKNSDVCREEELVLLDLGAEFRNYAADITRTIPAKGRFTSRQKECYHAVLEIMETMQKEIKPGTTIKELNDKIIEQLTGKHLELGLYKKKDIDGKESPVWKKYFPHGVSHFIGLDVHDPGDKNVILDKGMVISWEPGIYIPEENTGIRIEDDILVDNPSVNLSTAIPKDIEEIEQLT